MGDEVASDKPDISQEAPSGAFNPDAYTWETDLKEALEELRKKKPVVDLLWRYYDDDHPRLWLTDDMTKMFDSAELNLNSEENWIDVAVDAPLKRMAINSWKIKDPASTPDRTQEDTGEPQQQTIATKAVDNVFKDNDLELEQIELYRHAEVAGEGFLFAWKDEERESGLDISLNDTRNVYWPEDSDRADPRHVVKVWMDKRVGVWRATVYYKFVCVRLVGPKINDSEAIPSGVRYFNPDTDDPGGPHGFERVPVVRFSLRKKRKSLVQRLIPTQDRLNKLEANKMVAAEWSAWRRLAIMTKQDVDPGDAQMRPNSVLILDPGGGEGQAPTKIWEGQATELENFDKSIDQERDKIFTKANLPSHFAVTKGKVAPSGAEREADEGPFVENIKHMHRLFGASWSDLWKLCFGLEVEPEWRNPAIKSDNDEMINVSAAMRAGIPLDIALRQLSDWPPEIIALIKADMVKKEAEAKALQEQIAAGGGSTENDTSKQPPGQPPNKQETQGAKAQQSFRSGPSAKPSR